MPCSGISFTFAGAPLRVFLLGSNCGRCRRRLCGCRGLLVLVMTILAMVSFPCQPRSTTATGTARKQTLAKTAVPNILRWCSAGALCQPLGPGLAASAAAGAAQLGGLLPRRERGALELHKACPGCRFSGTLPRTAVSMQAGICAVLPLALSGCRWHITDSCLSTCMQATGIQACPHAWGRKPVGLVSEAVFF